MKYLFFFNDTATTEIYTLSLHDALPISGSAPSFPCTVSARASESLPSCEHFNSKWPRRRPRARSTGGRNRPRPLRQSRAPHRSEEHTSELQSRNISYAVFCLKKKTHATL